MFGSADEIEVFPFDLIHHSFHIRLAHDAFHHFSVDHKRRNAVGKAFIDHEIPGISQNGRVQTGHIAHQIVKSVAGNAPCGIHIHSIELFHDLGVIGNLKIGHFRLSEALHFHSIAVIRPQRHGRIDHIRNLQHNRVNFIGQFSFHDFQSSQPVSICLYQRLNFFRLFQFGRILFCLPHQHTDLFGELIAACTQIACLADSGAVLRIQLQNLIHQRQFGILIFFLNVFLYSFGIIPDKFNIKHFLFPFPYCFYSFFSFSIRNSLSSAP